MISSFFVSDVSQWILCGLQITSLLSITWLIGRLVYRRFPDIAASIGTLTLIACGILVLITLAGVPRPFELSGHSGGMESTVTPAVAAENSGVTAQLPERSVESSALFERLANLIQYSITDDRMPTADEPQWIKPSTIVGLMLALTFLGCLIGITRFAYSSSVIHSLARSSNLIENSGVQKELSRIIARLPTTERLPNITIRQFDGEGSPFVSWVTGNSILVPKGFLGWSQAEQSASLAHEISHLFRRDQYGHAVTQLAFCLSWLHPLSWILRRQITLTKELATDQMAAQLTENTTAYCRGLSRLALRFDAECRQPSTVGVTISSSLIRRIKMLRKSTFHRSPVHRFVNRVISGAALMAFTWIGCWSVEAQTSAQDNQTESKVVKASYESPAPLFSQPVTKPWDTIGNQSGYVCVQAGRILNHPDLKFYKPILSTALDSVLSPNADQKSSTLEYGLDIGNIQSIQSGLLVSYHHNTDAPDGHRSQLSLGASTLEITSMKPVNWPDLIRAIDLERVGGLLGAFENADLENVKDAWSKSAKRGHSNVFQTNALLETPPLQWNKPNEAKKTLWDAVSGGTITAVYDIVQSGEVPEDYKEEDPFNQANLEMTIATETAAWGFDMTPDYRHCQIRFAAVPKAGVSMDQLKKKFDALRAAIMETDADDAASSHFIEQLKKATVTVVKGETMDGQSRPSYLLVVGQCSTDFGKLGLIKNVAAPSRPQATTESNDHN